MFTADEEGDEEDDGEGGDGAYRAVVSIVITHNIIFLSLIAYCRRRGG